MATSHILGVFIILFRIYMIYAEICGRIISSSSGYILPPMQNGTYKSNLFCRWEITNIQNKSIALSATLFSVEESPDCIWDYIEIRDGEDNSSFSVGRFCGYKEFHYLSVSSSVYVYFVTDELQNEQGFNLKYHSAELQETSRCDSVINTETYIASPGYPKLYPSSSTCIYRIIAPDNHHVQVNFLEMSVDGYNCYFDRLDIYDGVTSHSPLLGTYCGDVIPLNVSSSSKEMLVVFQSDYMTEDRGFLAFIEFVDDKSPHNVPDEVTDWIQTLNSMEGTVTSPGYPAPYKNNMNCTIKIVAPIADHQIMLQFTHLEVEDSPNCTFDSVSVILDSNHEFPDVTICGLLVPEEPFFSKEGYLQINFNTDSLVTWSGFSADYKVIPRQVCFPRCGNDSVCVKDGKQYRCIHGSKCLTNVCNNGHCVKTGLANVQCFCPDGYTGLFCAEVIKIAKEELMFIKTPEDRNVERGTRVLLECKVNDDTAEYMWFYEDLILQTDKDVVTIYPGGVLDIASFDEKFEGLYKCLATTSSNFLEQEFRLTVAEPCTLSIQVPPMDTVVEEGSVALMSCYVDGFVNVTWLKEDVIIMENEKVKTLSDGQYLTISNAVPTDSGQYRCMLKSQDGCQVQRSAQLSVIPASGFNSHCARDILIRNPRVRMSGRITHGYAVEMSSAPWHAILRMRSRGKTFCGASLISNSWLVTAAHCIQHFQIEFKESFTADKIDIYLGTNSCNGDEGLRFGIKTVVVHEKFGSRAVYDNDIALIQLDKPVEFTESIKPVCLQPSSIINANYLTHNFGRKMGRVVGCGQYSEFRKASPDHLREVYIPYVKRQACAAVNIGEGNFTDSMFCAGYLRRNMGDACFGDSGGSLTMRLSDNHPWVLVGIVSWGIGCDREDHYGYYTHISEFENWIHNHTASDLDL